MRGDRGCIYAALNRRANHLAPVRRTQGVGLEQYKRAVGSTENLCYSRSARLQGFAYAR